MTPLLIRLTNLYAKITPRSAITTWISSEHHDYFTRHVLAGENGAIQAVASHLWFKFHKHCSEVELIPPVWNLDGKNPERLAYILDRLNFQDVALLHETISSLQNELTNLRSLGPGCANPSLAKPKTKPTASDCKQRRTGSSRSKVPNPSSPTKSPEGSGNSQAESKAEG